MRPCDCKDEVDAKSMDAQCLRINEWSLCVKPAVVEIEHLYYGKMKMPMHVFKKFAEWYLKDHDRTCDCENGCSSSTCDRR